MITITTPGGHIGSQLVQLLLHAGEKLRVVTRDPNKLPADVRAKVEVVQGSLEEEASLIRACQGAEALFHCVPASFATTDVYAYYERLTRPAIAAAQKTKVKRVVSVSGIGRHSELDAGIVGAAIAKDREWEKSGIAFRALWCPGFMDNMLMVLPTLKQGFFAWPADANLKRPMVATRDIAAMAAKWLRDPSWTGAGGVAVLGPEDISMNQMAATLSEVLGRSIQYRQVAPEAYQAQLVQYGAHPEFARQMLVMYDAKDRGLDASEPRTAENTTPTSFRQYVSEVLKPLM